VAKHERFNMTTLGDLRDELNRLGLALPIETDLSILADTVKVGSLETPNRFVILPMEGLDAASDGAPGELTFRRYLRYARGGAGLIWFEATAVVPEGRSSPRQLRLHSGNVDVWKRLVKETRLAARDEFGHELILVVQLTHSGRYSKPANTPEPIITHHDAVLDPTLCLADDYALATDEYIDRLQDAYVDAARLAAQAGFDGVDVKACHRYLVSELLAGHTRPGRYGGPFENRTRMLRETLARIAAEVPEVFATTRLSLFDGIRHPYGWGVDRRDPRLADPAEPIRLVWELKGTGIPILNVSIGNPRLNPHFVRPFDIGAGGQSTPDEHPLEGVARIVEVTGRIQQSQPDLPVVAFGCAWLRHLMPYVAAGFIRDGAATLVGQGRGAFAYPDSVRDILEKGEMDPKKCCITCSACTDIMRGGGTVGCPVRDKEVYGAQLRRVRRKRRP